MLESSFRISFAEQYNQPLPARRAYRRHHCPVVSGSSEVGGKAGIARDKWSVLDSVGRQSLPHRGIKYRFANRKAVSF